MTLDEDKTFIKLCCNDCENIECEFAEMIIGYVSADSKKGCSREVDDLTASKFFHYMYEIIPLWKTIPEKLINEQYFEIIDFLNKEVYNKPITAIYNNVGKVLLSKEEIVKEFNKMICERF